jgi:hypothetical protein
VALLVIGSYDGASMLHRSPESDVEIPDALESRDVKGAERFEQAL